MHRLFLKITGWTVFALLILVYIYPILITFSNSFMSSWEAERNYSTQGDIFHSGTKNIEMYLIPEQVSLSQYAELLIKTPVYLNMFWNSVKLVLPIVAGQLVVSALAAYGFSVLSFRGKEALFFIYVIVMLLPLQVTLMPNYMVAKAMNFDKSYLAIILPGIFHPFGVFLLRQMMKMIPGAYLEAARMDGAGHLTTFLYIALPMCKAGVGAAAMLTFVDYWNMVDQAVIFIEDSLRQPLSLFLANSREEIGLAFAGSCFYMTPILIILYFGQDYLKEGIQLTGIKG